MQILRPCADDEHRLAGLRPPKATKQRRAKTTAARTVAGNKAGRG
jgi:hypothetical protein